MLAVRVDFGSNRATGRELVDERGGVDRITVETIGNRVCD